MIVSNSTPLINFAAIDRLDILEALFTKLIIPPAVEFELLERGAQYPNVTIIRQAAFIKKHDIHNEMLRTALSIDLDPGEAEAIILALEQKADLLLLDELAGRTIAESYQIAFTGSIGCLIEAKRYFPITFLIYFHYYYSYIILVSFYLFCLPRPMTFYLDD